MIPETTENKGISKRALLPFMLCLWSCSQKEYRPSIFRRKLYIYLSLKKYSII
jgi:hypothetical protein